MPEQSRLKWGIMTTPARSPYRGNLPRTYWKTAVSGRGPDQLEDLHTPKFQISPETKIATAGSCFAQHIARNLQKNGYTVLDVEPPPAGLSDEKAPRFGFRTYSARYGNLYHVRQLLQLAQEVFQGRKPSDLVWEKNGRYYDALRPSVEPEGLREPGLVLVHRLRHLEQVRKLFLTAEVMVFTFGLTEAWVSREDGTAYPTAPGTVAGDYDPERYEFVNFRQSDLLADFLEFRNIVQEVNPGLKFLVTVSPVALAATATGEHVLVSTAYSKATLRSVAGELSERFEDVDYFPSYEIITGVAAGNSFFDSTGREVTQEGVECVMSYFFHKHKHKHKARLPLQAAGQVNKGQEEHAQAVVCEDVLLEAFGP